MISSVLILSIRLAAVDMHTAQNIVDCCLQGSLMRGRTVVLVTHHISLCLRVASYIVELSGGKVIRSGLVKDLKASNELKTVIEAEDDTYKEEGETPNAKVTETEADELSEVNSEVRATSSGKLVEAEHRAEGRVSIWTYITYVRAAGWVSWLLTLSLMLLIRVIAIANDVRIQSHLLRYSSSDLNTSICSCSSRNGLKLSTRRLTSTDFSFK